MQASLNIKQHAALLRHYFRCHSSTLTSGSEKIFGYRLDPMILERFSNQMILVSLPRSSQAASLANLITLLSQENPEKPEGKAHALTNSSNLIRLSPGRALSGHRTAILTDDHLRADPAPPAHPPPPPPGPDRTAPPDTAPRTPYPSAGAAAPPAGLGRHAAFLAVPGHPSARSPSASSLRPAPVALRGVQIKARQWRPGAGEAASSAPGSPSSSGGGGSGGGRTRQGRWGRGGGAQRG